MKTADRNFIDQINDESYLFSIRYGYVENYWGSHTESNEKQKVLRAEQI